MELELFHAFYFSTKIGNEKGRCVTSTCELHFPGYQMFFSHRRINEKILLFLKINIATCFAFDGNMQKMGLERK